MTFLDGLLGSVAFQHFPSPSFLPVDNFKAKQKVKARLLWVDIAAKKVGLTLQRQLVEGHAHKFDGVEIGSTFEG